MKGGNCQQPPERQGPAAVGRGGQTRFLVDAPLRGVLGSPTMSKARSCCSSALPLVALVLLHPSGVVPAWGCSSKHLGWAPHGWEMGEGTWVVGTEGWGKGMDAGREQSKQGSKVWGESKV